MSHLISLSLLNADFGNLKSEIEMINHSEADWFHLDIMDGSFVPNISFGFPVLKHIKKLAKKPLDIHLMISKPDRFLNEFKNHGAYFITVHYEACKHLHKTIQKIKSLDVKAGVSLNPHTPVHLLEEIISDIDMVLLMSVIPGYGGQKFIENTYNKVRTLKQLIDKKKSSSLIEIDGGVDLITGRKLVDSGVNVLVAGSFVFNSNNPAEIISRLKQLG